MAVTLVPPSPPETRRRNGRGVDQHPSAIPTVLVTNDGVAAPGLAALAAAAAGIGRVGRPALAGEVDMRDGRPTVTDVDGVESRRSQAAGDDLGAGVVSVDEQDGVGSRDHRAPGTVRIPGSRKLAVT